MESKVGTEGYTEDNAEIKIIRQSAEGKSLSSASALNKPYSYLFKIALIGDSGIGKSSILLRFTQNDFKIDTSSTIGVDFKIVSVSLGDNTLAKMQIWDTCGSERFRSLTSSFIKSCNTFLLVFDITKHKSFKNLESWLGMIKENTSPKLLCLIGNKSDLEENRQVSREEALKFAAKFDLEYLETSAKSNQGVDDVFLYVAKTLHREVRSSQEVCEIGGGRNLVSEVSDSNKEVSLKKKCC